jgi:outer membrane lipoprotein-sorting protein
MRRRLVLTFCIAALVAPAARAAEAKRVADKRAAGLTSEQIVARNVEARGGLQAWRAVKTLKLSGEMDAGGTSDAKLPFVLSLKRPHKSRLEITFAGKNAIQVYDGTQGWKLRPYLNRDDVDPFTPAEARSAAASAELDGPLVDHVQKGARVELAGKEKVEGKETYKLKLTLKSGEQRFLWVDAKTFLEARISGEPRKLDGRAHDVWIYYRDYRKVNGLKMPYVTETVVKGVKASHKLTLKTVTLNPPLDDALFAKPSAAVAKASGR